MALSIEIIFPIFPSQELIRSESLPEMTKPIPVYIP